MTEKMQAAGTKADAAQGGLPPTSGKGDGNGGAYPNPHEDASPKDGIMGHGGQSEIAYHGEGQLGDEKVPGEKNENSVTREG